MTTRPNPRVITLTKSYNELAAAGRSQTAYAVLHDAGLTLERLMPTMTFSTIEARPR